MRFDGRKFRADTHVQDAKLAGVLPAIEHRNFPIDELHWDGGITQIRLKRGSGPFEHFESLRIPCGRLPNNWRNIINCKRSLKFRYRYDPNTLTIDSGEFETPSSRGTARRRALPAHFGNEFAF